MDNMISETQSLYDWCQHNDYRGRQLRYEYTFRDLDGNIVDIKKLPFDSRQELSWKCQYGHTWTGSVYSRIRGHDCPVCYEENYGKWKCYTPVRWSNHPEREKRTSGTSYAEQYLYQGLLQIYPNTKNRYQAILKKSREKIEYDIALFIKSKQYKAIFIEFNPTGWHRYKIDRDEYKKKLCKINNIKLIQIVEDTYKEMKETWEPDYICFHLDYNDQSKYLNKVLDYILRTLGHSIKEIDLYKVREDAWKYSHGHIPYNESLLYKYPELAKEWSSKNDIVDRPEFFKIRSSFRVWWHCPYCNREWETTISGRAAQFSGCKECGFNWKKLADGQPQIIKAKYRTNNISA